MISEIHPRSHWAEPHVLPAHPTPILTVTQQRHPGPTTTIGIDIEVPVGGTRGRLISNAECGATNEWTIVTVGVTEDAEDVCVRIVDEESLLVEAGRSTMTPRILVAHHGDADAEHLQVRRQLICELHDGGPIRGLFALSGATSLVIDRVP